MTVEILLPGWLALPDGDRYRLAGVRVPRCLVTHPPAPATADMDGLLALDIDIAGGVVTRIQPAGATAADWPVADAGGGQLWPGFVDLHTHLDKGHIWPRAQNPNGSFTGALDAVVADRASHWRAEDVAARMDFALRCAYAHGTVAIRTHLDSEPAQAAISWPAFAAARQTWAGRIELQAASIVSCELFRDAEAGAQLADLVAKHGGILGAVTYPVSDAAELIDRMVVLAAERGLDLDLHVDESGDPGPGTLATVADAVLRRRFRGRVVCGHCCALAVQPPALAETAIARVAEAGIAVVSLPMCNLYLQDRKPGRTPRWRGITLLHELAAAGVPVAVASDNTRDPFHFSGDLDMLEVFAQAARIGHLDHPFGDWARAVTSTPAAAMGLLGRGEIAVGGAADLLLFRGRTMSELLARPQHDRVVIRRGRAIRRLLPDYRELDPLFANEARP